MWLEVGQQASRETTVTAADVRTYANLTGDRNPLHFDEDFVEGTRFERLMGHGGITTGLLHALIATDLPGPGSVFVRQQWSFPRPVYIGDTIRATATVTRANERRHFAELAIEIRNQDDEVVLEGEATVYQALPA
jgi:acyl dehydratase